MYKRTIYTVFFFLAVPAAANADLNGCYNKCQTTHTAYTGQARQGWLNNCYEGCKQTWNNPVRQRAADPSDFAGARKYCEVFCSNTNAACIENRRQQCGF